MAQRILVTGAAGFIGRHALAPLAARGFEVHAVTRGAVLPGATSHAVDLMDVAATRGLLARLRPSHLLHLAWTVAPGGFWTTRDNLDWVSATLALYRAFAANGGARFVGVGSCAEYDWSPDAVAAPLDEQASPCRPATLYGIAKDSTHRMLAAAAALDGVSLAWGRVFFLYGPGEKPGRLVSDTVVRLLRGEPIETTPGTQRRDFLHVADVAGALAALVGSEMEGPVNIASGEDRPIAEFLGEIGRQSGRADLLRFGARPMPANEPARLAAQVARLRNAVGFTPRFDMASGIADTIAAARHPTGG
ncbi:NAD-dependent epimerase/dehydratase family protein [Plastoroseomonas arctica]|uniref:NAD-dependent epimerase/dehydratase family protein n=1 Tax=Plastoroseomonas arctica TaxID=1509237 RepID=UPI001BADAA01